jgi:hypothetical protein
MSMSKNTQAKAQININFFTQIYNNSTQYS